MELPEKRSVLPQRGLLPNLGVATAALTFPFLASLVNLLQFNRYPLQAAEAWPIYGAIVLAGLVFGGLYLLAPRAVRMLLEAGLVAAVVDLHAAGVAPLIAFVATLAASYFSKRGLLPAIAFASLLLLAMSVTGLGAERRPALDARPMVAGPAGKPTILHLILDEHVGVQGLPADNPMTPARRGSLAAAYVDQGFRVYGGAFSRHMHTINAIPAVMNFGAPVPPRSGGAFEGVTLASNAYFEMLRRQNYRTTVYQNGWVDLCRHYPEIRCLRFPETGLLGLHATPVSTSEKTSLIVLSLLEPSAVAQRAFDLFDRQVAPALGPRALKLVRPGGAQRELTSSILALGQADRLIADLARAQPGQAYVAHMLFPHYPFVTYPDCRMKPHGEWLHRRSGGTMRARQDASFDQMLCAANIVGRAEAALRSSAAGKSYVIIVHSDHGSRITRQDPGAKAVGSDTDVVASYSALFAIKAPSVEPGYVAGETPLERLLYDFAASDFRTAPTRLSNDRTIYLADGERRPVRRATMPNGWAPVLDDPQ